MLKKNSLILILVFFVIGLAIGKATDQYVTLNPLSNGSLPSYPYIQNNAEDLIHVKNQTDIASKRNTLINYVWKDNVLPTYLPTQIEQNISDPDFSNMENLKQIDKISVKMDHGIDSIAYLFLSENNNNKLVIYHQGHDGGFVNGKKSIEFFLKNHYSVLAFSMPLYGMNSQPVVDLENEGKIKLISHNQLSYLDSERFSSIKFFVEPIVVSLNYIDQNYKFDRYSMIGISGGGWTTTLYSAIDTRITQSYSVAGSLPLYLRYTQSDMGDYEQTLPGLYRIANYLDLYTMAANGDDRKHVQIFNKYDPCCFANPAIDTYVNAIQLTLTNLGAGNFSVYIDDTHREHKISDHALQIILDSMKE